MRPRKLKLVAQLGGMPLAWGEVKVQNFSRMRESDTTLVCPECGEKPKFSGGYHCEICDKDYNHWTKLRRILTATHEIIERDRLIDKGEIPKAHIFVMDSKEFADRYADATMNEYGIVTNDPTTAKNIRNLVIAVDRLGKVVIVRFNDTYEERIALLTRNESNRVILREIIPLNLALIQETMRINMESVTDKEVEEASQIVKMIQEADQETFIVSDYRTKGLEEATVETAEVLDFEEILAKVSQ
jgi:hypothetical protein